MATGPKPPSVSRLKKYPLEWAGMVDKETGKQGRIFRVESVEWTCDDEVQVEGGYFENGLSATGMTYQVEWEGGRWVVTDERMNWIS